MTVAHQDLFFVGFPFALCWCFFQLSLADDWRTLARVSAVAALATVVCVNVWLGPTAMVGLFAASALAVSWPVSRTLRPRARKLNLALSVCAGALPSLFFLA